MQGKLSLRFASAILVLGIILGLVIAASFDFTPTSLSVPQVSPQPNVILGSQESIPEALLEIQNTSDAFVYIAERVVPTVVTIRSTRLINSSDLQRFHNRDELKDFFRFRVPKEFRQHGSGSGIIVSEDGYVLTNVHVVDNSENVEVILFDNREFEASIVGLDPLTEVAVIKVDAKNLPVARLGDSDKSRVGEWVLAIGNPLDLRSTVTAGIISAKERQIDIMRDSYSVENFIQTDAAINPGNSGGALVNLRGEVIGVNTAIATETGYNAGFGFAIPINLAKKIMNDMIHKGKVERAFLGIAMLNVDEQKARELAMDRPRGVFIDKVLANSPAAKSGLRSRDVIVKIDDEEVNKSNQVQAIVARKNPDEVIRLVLIRNGEEIERDVRLQKRESETVELSDNKNLLGFKDLGIEYEDLTLEKARKLAYAGSAGVIVTEVKRWSPAYRSGIKEMDIIIEIDSHAINNRVDFHRVLSKVKKGAVTTFKIVRHNEESHILVRVPNE